MEEVITMSEMLPCGRGYHVEEVISMAEMLSCGRSYHLGGVATSEMLPRGRR